MFKKIVHDLFQLRDKYNENGLENLRLSNDFSKNFQTATITVVLAELAFIGVMGFGHCEKILSATIATILVIALILFMIGISIHQISIQTKMKKSFSMSVKVNEYIKEHKKSIVETIPDDLILKEDETVKITNFGSLFLKISYILIILSSLLLIIMIWMLIL